MVLQRHPGAWTLKGISVSRQSPGTGLAIVMDPMVDIPALELLHAVHGLEWRRGLGDHHGLVQTD